jgi:hypothetical protein
MRQLSTRVHLLALALVVLLLASAVHAADIATPVNLNTATESEIEALGISKKSAEKIIANRPYSSATDLSKAGISARKISKLSDRVTFGDGTAATSPAAAASVASQVAPPSPSSTAKHSAKTSEVERADAGESSVPAQTPPQPGMVWVNSKTKVYHTEGDRYYGKTKHGKWMTEADAIKEGDRKSKQE